jgi:hypothetical protein
MNIQVHTTVEHGEQGFPPTQLGMKLRLIIRTPTGGDLKKNYLREETSDIFLIS